MTSYSNPQHNRSKSSSVSQTIYILILVVLGVAVAIKIGYEVSLSNVKFISRGLLALFAGLLFESFRISDNWLHVIYKFIAAYLISLVVFLPFKSEHVYNFAKHIAMWPYAIIVLFAFFTAVFNGDKVTAKLNEGITLLHSLSLLYWIIDYGFGNIDHWFIVLLVVVALVFCAFSIVHALTYITLSRTVRLTLSVWSVIVVVFLAIDNMYCIYDNEAIETTKYLSQGLFIGLQYFLLGVCSIYITQNFILLLGFLPSKGGNYGRDLRETKKEHIERYSERQVFISHSMLCMLYALAVYGLNYTYQALPRNTMIWLVILTFPFVLYLIESTSKRKR